MSGLTGEEFRALPEIERDRLVREHTRQNMDGWRDTIESIYGDPASNH